MSTPAEAMRSRFTGLSPRERIAVAAALLIVLLAGGWALVWQPLARDLAQTERQLEEAQGRLSIARQRADEAATLAREARPTPTSDLRAAAERVLAQRGLRGATTAIDAQEAGIRITFASIALDALAPLIDALGREEQLFPVEMTLTARVEPGTVRADMTLARERR
jgi:type II secretory pathway component PulM